MPKRQKNNYVVVLTTCGSRREAARIARSLVKHRLAACVNIGGAHVHSVYSWKGKIEQAKEFLLLIKTTRSRLTVLRAEIERLHSYDVPEFLVLPVAGGSRAYLGWLDDCLRLP